MGNARRTRREIEGYAGRIKRSDKVIGSRTSGLDPPGSYGEIHIVFEPAPKSFLMGGLYPILDIIRPPLHHLCINRPQSNPLSGHLSSPVFANRGIDIGQTERDVP